jgi:hypothetical protein
MAYGYAPTTGLKKPTAVTKVTLPKKPGTLTPRPQPGGTQAVRGGTSQSMGVPITPRPTPTSAPPRPPIAPGGVPQQFAGEGGLGAGTTGGGVAGSASVPYNPDGTRGVGGGIAASNLAPGNGQNTDLSAPLTGLAGSFDPSLLQYVYAQPELILKQLMQNNGQSPLTGNSGLFTAATPYMDALMSILPLAFGGGGQPNASAPINWMGDMMQQGMTPGGQGIDFGSVMRAAQDQLKNTSSATSQYYNAPGMDPLDQINKMKELVLGAGSAGLAPQFQTALKNALNSASLNYMGKFTTGQQAGNFPSWFLNSSYLNGYK